MLDRQAHQEAEQLQEVCRSTRVQIFTDLLTRARVIKSDVRSDRDSTLSQCLLHQAGYLNVFVEFYFQVEAYLR